METLFNRSLYRRQPQKAAVFAAFSRSMFS
jgi:hypothetical protein